VARFPKQHTFCLLYYFEGKDDSRSRRQPLKNRPTKVFITRLPGFERAVGPSMVSGSKSMRAPRGLLQSPIWTVGRRVIFWWRLIR
jgi:hypothetical protein